MSKIANKDIYFLNREVISKAVRSFKTHEVDINIYVDGNHFRRAIDAEIDNYQECHNRMFEKEGYDKLEAFKSYPELERNEVVYARLIYIFLRNLERRIFREYSAYFFNKFGKELISEDMISIAGGGAYFRPLRNGREPKIFTSENDFIDWARNEKIMQFVGNDDTSTSVEISWKKNKTELMVINHFVNFFIGGDLDTGYLIKVLEKEFRQARSKTEQDQLRDFLDRYGEAPAKTIKSAKQKIRDKQYLQFKQAMKKFDKSYLHLNVASETNEGFTRFDVKTGNTVFVKVEEKAVDTKLVLKSFEDSLSSGSDSIFVFITNDNDFFPLFERIQSTRQLLWFHGGPKERRANALAKIVPETHTESIAGLMNPGNAWAQVPHIDTWEEQFNEWMKAHVTVDYPHYQYGQMLDHFNDDLMEEWMDAALRETDEDDQN